MIQNKMTSMGITGVKSIDEAVQRMTVEQASSLEDFIDTKVDGGGEN
jgi:hypothetical protein